MHLPYRLSERAFRTFEPYIATIVSRHPMITRFNPKHLPMARSTFVPRLRDAMASFAKHQWASDIPYATFMEVYTNVVVSEVEDAVCVGPRSAIHSRPLVPPTPVLADAPPMGDVQVPDLATLRMLCVLSAKRYLSCPLRLSVPPEWVVEVQSQYDVEFEDLGDGMYLLI